MKPLLQQVFLAPDHRTALRRGQALIARFQARFPSAMECLAKGLDEGLTSLLFPAEHRKRLRTTNLLERTFLRAPDALRAEGAPRKEQAAA